MLIWTTSDGQLAKLKGTWISSSNDFIVIKDTTTTEIDNDNFIFTAADWADGMTFRIVGDTLSFQNFSYLNNYNWTSDRYDFLLISLTDSTLTVNPSSELSKKLFKNRTNLKFINQKNNIDPTISFEKLIYRTTESGIGNSPKIEMQIDSTKKIYFRGTIYKGDFFSREIDDLQSGEFTGILNDTLYNELIHLLQTCSLRTLNLQYEDPLIDDASIITLIIYYNGQRKCLRSPGYPILLSQLIEYLYSLNQRATLPRTNEMRELEYCNPEGATKNR